MQFGDLCGEEKVRWESVFVIPRNEESQEMFVMIPKLRE
jgi:hypothetical protein